MTRFVSDFRRTRVREVAHTAKVVAEAAVAISAAVALAAIAAGAIGLAYKIWSF